MEDHHDDKPFSCTEAGCTLVRLWPLCSLLSPVVQQKFATEDHLSAHLKRHKMCLTIGTPTGSGQLTDQTPTPSRFLGNFAKQWEEVGLDITEIAALTPNKSAAIDDNSNSKSSCASNNPFAASFQQALERQNSVSASEKLLKIPSNRQNGDSPLNTPSIIPTQEATPQIYSNNEGLLAIVNAVEALNSPDVDMVSANKLSVITSSADLQQNSSSAISSISQTSSISSSTSSTSTLSESSTSLSSCLDKNSKTKRSFQAVPVICNASTTGISVPASSLSNILMAQSSFKTSPAKMNSFKTTALIAPKTSKDASPNNLYKVILKLPDGRSVQLPFQPVPSASVKKIVEAEAITISESPVQKQIKSKASSQTNLISPTLSTSSSSSSSSSSFSKSSKQLKASLQSRVDALSATLASLPPRAKPGRKSKFAPEEDPIEKKLRSLERNRAAAMRCRLKRKQWVDSLEDKADELEKTNERLQNEVLALRREVSLLKTALLAHKDCPVTLQQNKSSNLETNGSAINSHEDTNGST